MMINLMPDTGCCCDGVLSLSHSGTWPAPHAAHAARVVPAAHNTCPAAWPFPRLSAAKSKMRQRVLSESLEILKAKENSRNASVERSDGPTPPPPKDTATMEELRQVKRTCLELQVGGQLGLVRWQG